MLEQNLLEISVLGDMSCEAIMEIDKVPRLGQTTTASQTFYQAGGRVITFQQFVLIIFRESLMRWPPESSEQWSI